MSARPRPEFAGKYTHDEIWNFAQRIVPATGATPEGFSVASAMIEQLLAERDQFATITRELERYKIMVEFLAEELRTKSSGWSAKNWIDGAIREADRRMEEQNRKET